MRYAILLTMILLVTPGFSAAETATYDVARTTQNLYQKLSPYDGFIKTSSCSEPSGEATLTTSGDTGTLTFSASGNTCTVAEVFDRFYPVTQSGSPISLDNSRINVSYDAANWYRLNTFDTFEDNGKRLETSSCSESPTNEFANLTVNSDGIGYVSIGGIDCNVLAMHERVFVASIGSGSDNDGDGIINTDDNCPYSLNPDQDDSDGDGEGDACDTSSDSDGDGLTDAQEYALGTSPNDPDSDGDGLNDAQEIAFDSNQLDRLFNYLEAQYPEFIAPAGGATATFEGYQYRYYPDTESYAGVKAGRLYYLGPVSNNEILDIGSFLDWYFGALEAGY